MSMMDILLAVSVGCNLWFLFLLLYDHIMETRLVRFLKKVAEVWRILGDSVKREESTGKEPSSVENDIIGKSRFKMASTRTTATTPAQETATSEKASSCRRKRLLLTMGIQKHPLIRHKSRKKSLTKHSQAFHPLNWSSGRMNRKRKPWNPRKHREAVSTR